MPFSVQSSAVESGLESFMIARSLSLSLSVFYGDRGPVIT